MEAEFIVGNPPFIGKGELMRAAFGQAYLDALWASHPKGNESADFVMYWWDHAAELLTLNGTALRRFGFVTTNSITQLFNRRVVERHLRAKEPVSLTMAIPDHPWTKTTPDAAAVRIAMTVAQAGVQEGRLSEVFQEVGLNTDTPIVKLKTNIGILNSDLTIGADVTGCKKLKANAGLSSNGVLLAGRGFVVTERDARLLGLGQHADVDERLRPYINGRELIKGSHSRFVIDVGDLHPKSIQVHFGRLYQHLIQTVKKERDAVLARTGTRDAREYADNWWRFAKTRKALRDALNGLPRFIGTTETTPHRHFQFIESGVVPDHMVIAIASADAFHLGVLSSHIHLTWALRAGGWLGVGNDPRYSKSRIFDPFPFPATTEAQMATIRAVAESLDKHRKGVLAEQTKMSLTGLYNVLAKLQGGTNPANLEGEDRRIFDDGLVLILKELHEELDVAVAEAYGWPADLSDNEVLIRLIALNKERAGEEATGVVRWLRPDYQIPRFGSAEEKSKLDLIGGDMRTAPTVAAAGPKPAFPTDHVAQTAAVMAALANATSPMEAAGIAALFRQGRRVAPQVGAVLTALARMGFVTTTDGRSFTLRRVA